LKNFISLDENKEDLALFLSGKLASYEHTINEIVVGSSEPNGFSTTRETYPNTVSKPRGSGHKDDPPCP